MARKYLRTFTAARAAVLAAGFDRVVTYGGAVPVAEWMSTREEHRPGSVVYFLDGNRLREEGICYYCRRPMAGDPDTWPACCRRCTGSVLILGIWPLLRAGETDPGPDPELVRRAAVAAGPDLPREVTA